MDVLEVFAVVIVYCRATMDAKIPLLFDLYVPPAGLVHLATDSLTGLYCFSFDFDHSRLVSEHELVLLMLCATRGLCKAVGLDRPSTADLEELAQHAFVSIDRNHDGQLSLQEFTDWVKREPHLLEYLKRFASSRLLYDNQTDFEALFLQLSASFEKFAVNLNIPVDGLSLSSPKLVCSLSACRAIIQQHCPATSDSEADYLVATMQATMDALPTNYDDADPITPTASKENSCCSDDEGDRVLPELITLPVFRVILAPYVAFIAADEDKQHVIDVRELKVLLWLLRGQEPAAALVQRFMNSLDGDHDGVLSAVEWVSYAIQHEAIAAPVLP